MTLAEASWLPGCAGHGTAGTVTPVKFEPSPLKMPVVVPPRARFEANCEPVSWPPKLRGRDRAGHGTRGHMTPVRPEPFPLKVPVKMPLVVPASARFDAS